MHTLTRAVYIALAAGAFVAAAAVLVSPAVILSPAANSPLTAHLMREQAAMAVFIGLMCVWCLRHFADRRPVHLALLVSTTIFAGVHWADYLQSYRHLMSPIVNSVLPLLLLVTVPRGSVSHAGPS